ncbi:MAG: DUF3352 domain-containing protein [Bacteroidales bacterium]
MFRNKVTILITVGVLAAIAIGLQFINKQSFTPSMAIKAIPTDAALVIETNNIRSLVKNFNESNLFKREFSDVQNWQKFFSEMDFIDSLLNQNEDVISILDGTTVTISGHLTANQGIDFLYVIPIKNKDNQEEIIDIFSKKVGKDNVQKVDYEGFIFYNAYNQSDNSQFVNFSFTFAKGLFIFSKSRICVEESVRMLNEGFSISGDKAFMAAKASAGKNVDANIYLNYHQFSQSIGKLLNNKEDKDKARRNARLVDFIGRFGAWTALDLKMKNDAFVLSGLTNFKDSLNNYLNAFKNQKPVDNEMVDDFPASTSAFIAVNFSNIEKWKDDYTDYLTKSDNFTSVNNYFEAIKKKNYKIREVREVFYNNTEGMAAIIWVNNNPGDADQEVFGILQLDDAEKMKKEILQINPKDEEGNVVVPTNSNIDAQKAIIAYKFPEPQVMAYLYGDAFKPVNAHFYMIYDSKLVFAESVEALEMFYQKSKKGSRLSDDKDFQQYSKSLASESNIYIYGNFAAFGGSLASELSQEYADIYKKYSSRFHKIQAASIQFGMGDNQMFTNIYVNYNPQFAKKSKNIWEVKLDTSFKTKPEIMKDFTSGNNEVIFQDDANNLVLIDESGKKAWKKSIQGRILGNIQQVDLYKNNKLQYLFNTSRQIYCVDHNGKDVEGFPITFKSPATNGIAVFDYDKDRNYRILVACENRKVYLLTATGSKVDGWAFNETQSEVVLPAQHFLIDSKDYIIFSDKTNTYIVNRRGETRVEVKSPFERSANSSFFFEKGNAGEGSRFVTSGKFGEVYFVFLDGQVKKMNFGEFSENHRFVYTDLDGDGKNYFIFTDKNKLTVYNRDKSVRFENKFDENLENSLNIYKITKNLKFIGVSPAGENKIYLLTNKGETVKGFPMQGAGRFSITKLVSSKDNEGLNVIVGGDGNFLYNYFLSVN